MTEKREAYKSREILIETAETDENQVRLSIDEKQIDVVRDENSGKYTTYILPYQEYSSIEDLAKDVIDYLPSFRTDQEQ
jgi:hypothetical protein